MAVSTTLARTCTRHVSSSRRCLSTTSALSNAVGSSSGSKSPTMSPEKLRAVISLYHAADGFITLENLEDRIDKAFVWNQELGSRRREIDLPQIMSNAEGGRGPRLGQAAARTSWGRVSRNLAGRITGTWAGDSRLSERGTRVAAALLGVDPSGKPGLETVQEEGERVQEWITYHAEDFKATARKGLPVSTAEDKYDRY